MNLPNFPLLFWLVPSEQNDMAHSWDGGQESITPSLELLIVFYMKSCNYNLVKKQFSQRLTEGFRCGHCLSDSSHRWSPSLRAKLKREIARLNQQKATKLLLS